MRFKLSAAAAAVAFAAFLVPAAASPAAAAEQGTRNIDESWGEGEATFVWQSPWSIKPIKLWAQDQKVDGHSVGVRVVSNSQKRGTEYFTMRKVTGGAGDTGSWETYLYFSDHDNINWVKLELCLLEEGKILECRGVAMNNPGGWDDGNADPF